MKKTYLSFIRVQNRRFILPAVCAGLLGFALPVLAQSAGEYESIQPGNDLTPAGQLQATMGVGHRFESDIDDGGKSSETALRTTLAGTYKVSDEFKLGLAGSFQWSHYKFSDLKSDPWSDVNMFRVTPLLIYAVDENWTVYGGPSFAYAGENGADFGDSVTAGGLAGFNYRASETLTLGAGFGIFSQIEDDAKLLPIITANWKFADQWALKVGFSEVAANGGIGAQVVYDLAENWQVGCGIQFEKKRFRLGSGEVVEDQNVPVYVKIAWLPAPKTSFEFVGGIAAGGKYTVDDSSGHEIGDTDYDSAALIGVRGVLQF